MSSATVRDIVNAAFQELLYLDALSQPAAQDAQTAVNMLNRMARSWAADGFDTSWPTVTLNSGFPLDQSHEEGVACLLAQRLAASFGTPAAPTTMERAAEGWKRLQASYMSVPSSAARTYVAEAGLVWTPGSRAYFGGSGPFALTSPVPTSSAFEWIVGDGINPVPSGVQGSLSAPANGSVTGWALSADAAGSVSIDVWRCGALQFDGGITHPVVADSITAASPMLLANSASAIATTVPGWHTSFVGGDWLTIAVSNPVGIKRLTVVLNFNRDPLS
jgi:hypothetical protein